MGGTARKRKSWCVYIARGVVDEQLARLVSTSGLEEWLYLPIKRSQKSA
jgi:hypothetical protein